MFLKIVILAALSCVIAVSVASVATLLETRELIHETRSDARELSTALGQIAITAAQAAEQVKQASSQANLAAEEQRKYWNKTSLETYKTMASLRLTIVRTDRSLNDELIPQISRSITDNGRLLADTQQELKPSLDNLARASAAAADAMADPHIRQALAHADTTSANLEAATVELAWTAQHIEDSTDAINKKVQQAMKPASLSVRIVERLLGLAGPAAQVAAAIK